MTTAAKKYYYNQLRKVRMPRSKIYGQRWGEIIYNSLKDVMETGDEAEIADTLFWIDNKTLREVIIRYIESL